MDGQSSVYVLKKKYSNYNMIFFVDVFRKFDCENTENCDFSKTFPNYILKSSNIIISKFSWF